MQWIYINLCILCFSICIQSINSLPDGMCHHGRRGYAGGNIGDPDCNKYCKTDVNILCETYNNNCVETNKECIKLDDKGKHGCTHLVCLQIRYLDLTILDGFIDSTSPFHFGKFFYNSSFTTFKFIVNKERTIKAEPKKVTFDDQTFVNTEFKTMQFDTGIIHTIPPTSFPKSLNKLVIQNAQLQKLEVIPSNQPNLRTIELLNNELISFPNTVLELPDLTSLRIRQPNKIMKYVMNKEQFEKFSSKITNNNIEVDAHDVSLECNDNTNKSTVLLPISGKIDVCVTMEAAPQPPEEDSSSNSLPIILAIVGVIVVILIIAGYIFYRRKRSATEIRNIQCSTDISEFTVDTISTSYSSKTNPITPPTNEILGLLEADKDLQLIRIDSTQLVVTEELSRGGFGIVSKGKYYSSDVAVKQLVSRFPMKDEVDGFVREIKLMSKLRHPKIVQFIGVAWTSSQDLMAVSEFLAWGDLRSVLDNKSIKMEWIKHRLSIAIDVIEALAYLHGLKPIVIHRDLKSKNILVDDYMRCKLTDFGLSRQQTTESTMTCGLGTFRWMAPELILGEFYDESVDIYAYGQVLSEIDTRQLPMNSAKTSRGSPLIGLPLLHQVSKGLIGPDISKDCPPKIRQLIISCCSNEPSERPKAKEIVRMLRNEIRIELEDNNSFEF